MRAPFLAAFCLCAAPLAAQQRNIVVRAVTETERAPLGYAVISLPDLGIERFASSAGVVVLQVPPGGPVKVRVKRLGFAPKDTVITPGDAVSTTVVVALARVTYRLREVRVVGWPPCKAPGLRAADQELRALVEQLRENAERYRLLTKQYPFVYTMIREMGYLGTDSSYISERRDAIPVEGAPDWTYEPGTLVVRERGTREWIMRIPSIGDLAEDAWIDNHCFHIAGVEEKEGDRLLRLDIVAAERLRAVDANASVWLDPQDFRLRHASFSLSKAPRQVPGLQRVTSDVAYYDLIPFVPVMRRLRTTNVVRMRQPRGLVRTYLEWQTIRDVLYQGPRPDSLNPMPARPDSLPGDAPGR